MPIYFCNVEVKHLPEMSLGTSFDLEISKYFRDRCSSKSNNTPRGTKSSKQIFNPQKKNPNKLDIFYSSQFLDLVSSIHGDNFGLY